MPGSNTQLMGQWVEAFNKRDMDALLELVSPDFEFSPLLATLLETTVYRGQAGLRKYFEDADTAWESIELRLDDIREVGEDLAVCFGELRGTGRASRLEVQVPMAAVCEFGAGRIVRATACASEAEALEAVGLSE